LLISSPKGLAGGIVELRILKALLLSNLELLVPVLADNERRKSVGQIPDLPLPPLKSAKVMPRTGQTAIASPGDTAKKSLRTAE
jgi:hypothetical protein